MDESQMLVQAVVKVPLYPSADIILRSLLKQVTESPLDSVDSDGSSDKCKSLIAQTCLQLVSVSSTMLLENLAPLTNYWCRKAQKLFDKMPPEKCFFGVQKKDIVIIMKKVLLEYMMKVRRRRRKLEGCSSFYNLIHLLAEEITKKINSHLALLVHSPSLLDCECQCVPLPLLNILAYHLANTLQCWHQRECKCPLLMKAVCHASPPTVPVSQPNKRRLCVKLGIFEVTYTSSDVQSMQILSHITDFTYARRTEGPSPVLLPLPVQHTNCTVESTRCVGVCEAPVATNPEIFATVQESPLSPLPVPDPLEVEVVVEDSLPAPPPDPAADESSITALPQDAVEATVDTETPPSHSQTAEVDKKHEVVFLLLVGLLLLTQEKAETTLSQERSDTAIKTLYAKAKSHKARFEDITISSRRASVDRTNRKLFNYFCKMYSSPGEFLRALTSEDPKIITFIITNMITQLILWSSTRPGPISRCFSQVGKTVGRPFRACFRVLTRWRQPSAPSSLQGDSCGSERVNS